MVSSTQLERLAHCQYFSAASSSPLLSDPPLNPSYDEETLEEVYKRFDKLRPGAIVMLTSHKMPSPMFEVLFEGRYPASWGEVTARIYRRKQLPAWVAGVLGRTGATAGATPRAAPASGGKSH